MEAKLSIDSLPHVKPLLSRFERVNNPIVSEFISSIPERLSDAVKRIREQQQQQQLRITSTNAENIISNRRKLAKYIAAFHSQADTDFAAVNQSRANLQDPSAQILVSIHQPNLFSYGGVFKKIVLLQTLKSALEQESNNNPFNTKFINLFLVVDHDFIDDTWMRVAQLPSIRHSNGILGLRMPIKNSNRWTMVRNMKKPSITIINHWKNQVGCWIKSGSVALDLERSEKLALLENLELFWKEVNESYKRATSYADFNSFLMSRVVNKIWGYDTLFVRLSDISDVFEDGFSFLLNNFRRYSQMLSESNMMFFQNGINTGISQSIYLNAPLWLGCECGSKASVKLRDGVLYGSCISCKKHLIVRLLKAHEIRYNDINRLSPKAIPILLLLSRDLGISCYALGMGGSIGYTMVGRLIFKELEINMPLTLFWASPDPVSPGLAQKEALHVFDPTIDPIVYAEQLRFKLQQYSERLFPRLTRRAELARKKEYQSEEMKTVLQELDLIKQEQRRTRVSLNTCEKVIKALTLKPCIIDYAVNIGLDETERVWRKTLLREDNLA
jgi:hypothetical protein